MKINQISLLVLFLFACCTLKSQKETATIQILPSDEIPMQYDKGNHYMPTLDATVNDSLHLKVFFDTGQSSRWPGASDSLWFIASDSLREILGDSASVQIGKYSTEMRIDFVRKPVSIFNLTGKNTIVVGWEFFDHKIIDFSFDKQRLRVYESLPDVTGYSKIKITLSSTMLCIPLKVILQGKTMEDTVYFDTGNNSYASFSTELIEKYGIDTENAYRGQAMTNVSYYSGYSLSVDTIKIGDLCVANPELRVAVRPKTNARAAPGLLGVKTMENFSVILDLINYDLYLKKLDQSNSDN
ncbi:MAG: hypothetical protein LBE91_03245 [Tannerella sp.]|nr:hypothetical protein [Tannerella sp.]